VFCSWPIDKQYIEFSGGAYYRSKIAATFQEERISAQKFTVNHHAKRISVRKIVQIKTIGVMKMRGNFMEISFEPKFLQKALKSQEFRRNLFALLLHNTVALKV